MQHSFIVYQTHYAYNSPLPNSHSPTRRDKTVLSRCVGHFELGLRLLDATSTVFENLVATVNNLSVRVVTVYNTNYNYST